MSRADPRLGARPFTNGPLDRFTAAPDGLASLVGAEHDLEVLTPDWIDAVRHAGPAQGSRVARMTKVGALNQ